MLRLELLQTMKSQVSQALCLSTSQLPTGKHLAGVPMKNLLPRTPFGPSETLTQGRLYGYRETHRIPTLIAGMPSLGTA